jgi:hypothetical protein
MNRASLLLLTILAGCDKNVEPMDLCADNLAAFFEPCTSITTVAADKCIIQEVHIQDGEGHLRDKFVYHHDGTNYNKIDRYYTEDDSKPFPITPTEIIKFNYYQNGLIFQVRFTSFLNPNNPSNWVSTYTYLNGKLNIRYDILEEDGSVIFSYNNDEFYLTPPKDSLYYFYGPIIGNNDQKALFDFKKGNLVRKGRTSKEGTCLMHDARWLFLKNYYDDLPNVLKNYAVRYPLSNGKIVYGTMSESYVEINENNIIGQIDNDGNTDERVQYCWTFLKNTAQTYWIKKFAADRPTSTGTIRYVVTYYYDCE